MAARRREACLTTIRDAGDGAGTWQVELRPQSASAGATIELPASVSVAPGGEVQLVATARAAADAGEGENYGFVVLRRGEETRRIPYFFLVKRPALATLAAPPLRLLQQGNTRGTSLVELYRYPGAAFGPPPSYTGPTMQQSGAERLYRFSLDLPAANFGVAVLAADAGTVADPWVLGSKDENDVQGAAGTPVNVNPLTFGFRLDTGAAGASLPRPGDYYVAVDSPRDEFTGRLYAGGFVLKAWVDDVSPPLILPVTTRVSAGRPTLVARVVDDFPSPGAGVDPLSLAIAYRGVLVGAAVYDPSSGLAIFPLSAAAPRDPARTDARHDRRLGLPGGEEREHERREHHAEHELRRCPAAGGERADDPVAVPGAPRVRDGQTRLVVVAGSTRPIRSVRFLDGRRPVATVRRGAGGLYGATWRTAGARAGRHVLRAVVTDGAGRTATAERVARICR